MLASVFRYISYRLNDTIRVMIPSKNKSIPDTIETMISFSERTDASNKNTVKFFIVHINRKIDESIVLAIASIIKYLLLNKIASIKYLILFLIHTRLGDI